jgi:hypothetical protein
MLALGAIKVTLNTLLMDYPTITIL